MARTVLLVRPLTPDEDRHLRRTVRRGDNADAVRRAQVVRLSARGMAPHAIADVLGRSWSGVRKTVNRFNREGIASLVTKPGRGRKSKVTERYVALLKEAVAKSPRDLGYVFTAWTQERLREHLARRTRVILSVGHLSKLMRDNRIVYRRPKHGMSHLRDPAEYDEKKAFLAFVKKGRPVPTPAWTSCISTSVRFISTRP